MTFRSFVQLPLNSGGMDARIDNQMLETPHDLLDQLADLYYGRNPDIGTLKRGGGIFI